jgi:Na+/H+-dicarboxylate symporter
MIGAMAENDILQIVVFSLFVGVAIPRSASRRGRWSGRPRRWSR